MNNGRKGIRYFIIVGAVVILALLLMLPSALERVRDNSSGSAGNSHYSSESAESSEGEDSGGQSEESGPEPGSYASGDGPLATLFCASDYQIEDGFDTPAVNFSSILDAAANELGKIDSVIMCGDYTNDEKLHDYQLSPEESIAEIRAAVKERLPELDDEDMIFEQGNHDALTESITDSGLHEYDDYLVYVLNTENDFPWKQGKVSGALKKVKASSKALGECLDSLAEKGETRPVIIAGHVPLHFTARTSSRHTTGDNLYSSLIFDAVNKAGEDLDIIYLFGHNHSKGWDCYMGGSSVYKAAGDTILIPEFNETDINTDTYTEEKLNFTYLNAGYTGYYMNCGTDELRAGTWKSYDAADTELTGTSIEIYSDQIIITRWDRNGKHAVSGKGEGDPYKGGIDEGLIPPEKYASEKESPQSIMRKAR